MPRSRFARIAFAAVVSVLSAALLLPPGPVIAAAGDAPDLGAFLAGVVAGQRGDDADAARFMDAALRADPDATPLRHTAFMFAALSGAANAPALAATVPPDLLSTLVLADAAGRNGDWVRAATMFAHLPNDPLVTLIQPLLLAWAQFGAGPTAVGTAANGTGAGAAVPTGSDAALRTLAGCHGPLNGTCLLAAGTIAELSGHTATAAALFDRTQSEFGLSSLGALQSAGSFFARHGRGVQADAMLNILVGRVTVLGMVRDQLRASLDRPTVVSAADGLASAYAAIAELLRETGGDNGKVAAGFMLRFALDLRPSLASARLTLAELQAPKHPAEASAILRGIAADDPLQPLAELRSATLDATPNGQDASITRLRALSDHYPDRPEPAEALGDVLSAAERWTDAANAYDRAIDDERRLGHGALSGEDWRILFSRAVAEDRADRWSQARADLQAALGLAPNEPFVLNYLGYSMVERRDDLPRARLLIQRALDGEPNDGSIRDSLGWVMLRQNDVSGAVSTLERAAEQDPEDPTVNFHLGAAYWAAGRRVEAQDQWRWALALHPDADAEKQIRDALTRAAAGTAGVGTP